MIKITEEMQQQVDKAFEEKKYCVRATTSDGRDLVDLLAAFAPDTAIRRKILVDNRAALYGFD